MKTATFLAVSFLVATPPLPGSHAEGQELTFRHFVGSEGGAGALDGPVARARMGSTGGVAIDAAGNVYVSDAGNQTIRRITPAGVVTTLAGLAGSKGSADGRGSAAQFDGPRGLAVDGAGNVFVADSGNSTIRKVSPEGVVVTYAGAAGQAGFADGSAEEARFWSPCALLIDGDGSLLVADTVNGRIRRISTAGVVTTLTVSGGALAGFYQPSGVAKDASGNLYVTEGQFASVIARLTPAGVLTTLAGSRYSPGSEDGTGVAARFNNPTGIASDAAGNLWVTDGNNATIRSVSPEGVVTTIAGSPLYGGKGCQDGVGSAARFDFPIAIVRAVDGDLLVADANNFALRSVTPGGAVTTVVGGTSRPGSGDGQGGLARFDGPRGLAYDGLGYLYVADTENSTIRRISPEGLVSTLAGLAGVRGSDDGVGEAARFERPVGIAVDTAGNVLVTDAWDHTIRRITPAGVVTTLAGLAGEQGSSDGTGSEARFRDPEGITVDGEGNAYVADTGNSTIRKVTANGVVTTLAGLARMEGRTDGAGAEARFSMPAGIAVDGAGSLLVADSHNHAIRRVSPAGVVTTVAGGAASLNGLRDGVGTAALFNGPTGIAVDPSGNAWVVDRYNAAIRRVTPEAAVSTVAGRPLPPGVSGTNVIVDGTGPAARFGFPQGIAVAADGRVFVSDANVVRLGRPALPDSATIDAVAGAVGVPRQLGTSLQSATSWLWEAIRIEGGSTAVPVPPTANDPTFTPDVDGYFVVRLTASSGLAERISSVTLAAGIVAPTANLSGRDAVCQGSSTALRAELTGTPPWSLVWSDGVTQGGVLATPATRWVEPAVSTTYSVSSVTNPHGQGSTSGSTVVTVAPPSVAAVTGGGLVCEGNPATIRVDLTGTGLFLLPGPFTLQWSDGVTEAGIWGWTHERVVTPSATTTYALASVVDDRCQGTASGAATVTLKPPPTATVSGSTTICSGQSAELRADLTGSGPWRIVWSDGLVESSVAESPYHRLVSPGTTSTYTVVSVSSVADPTCSSPGAGSATVTVVGVDPPDVTIATPSPVAPGAIGLVASVPGAGPGATYAWTITNGTLTSGQGTAAVTYSVGDAGLCVLTVTVSEPGGCPATGATWAWVGADPTVPAYFSRFVGPDGGGGWFDGPGANATFLSPAGIATDDAGSVYVLDWLANSVRKLAPNGRVTTLAGLAGASGVSDGRGPMARFRSPRAVAATASGTVYVADSSNYTVRRISPSGEVSTLAGIPGEQGSTDGGPGEATFWWPKGIAVDDVGNVFVADGLANTIRKVTDAGVVSTIAGAFGFAGSADGVGTEARFRNPEELAVDSSGNLYVADTGNHTIRKISPAGMVSTLAGVPGASGSQDGAAAQARFRSPEGVAVDGAGNVLVADTGNRTIRLVSTSGQVTTLAGVVLSKGGEDGTGPAARFTSPAGIALEPSGHFLIADSRSVRRMTPAGDVTTVAGEAEALPGFVDGPGTQARFSWPTGVVADGAGNVYVADSYNEVIRKVSPSGIATTLAGLAPECSYVDGTGGEARFCDPLGIAVDPSGVLYVADTENNAIRKVTPSGVVSTLAGNGYPGSRDGTGRSARFDEPWGLALDAAGNLFVGDSRNNTIRKVTPSGIVSTLAGTPGARGAADGVGSEASFDTPAGLAVDRSGNVYVADLGNLTIRKISPAGAVTTLAGRPGWGGGDDGTGSEARFAAPVALGLDGSGNLYVADRGNAALRKVTPDGIVTTIGGAGGAGGDADGTGSAAQLGAPYGVAVLHSGGFVLSDRMNHAIRLGVPSLPDKATIDSTVGSVGHVRQLGVSPSTATSWLWEVVRTEAGSAAALSSTTIPDPTFIPDVPGHYRFRLTSSDGEKKSVTLVPLYVDLAAATAVVSGSATICPGGWVTARIDLTGIPPWKVVWSDGETWEDLRSTPGYRNLTLETSTTLGVTSVSDAVGPGVAAGSAVFEVMPKTPAPVIEAPSRVGGGSVGLRASVPGHPGSAYSWSVNNGTITSGWGTREIEFTAGAAGTMTVSVIETMAGLCASEAASATIEVVLAVEPTLFYPVTPCRVHDTREVSGPTGGQPVAEGATLVLDVGGRCGVPATARAVTGNVTVTQPSGSGQLVVFPADEPKPVASTIHFATGRTRAASSHLKLSTDDLGSVAIANDSTGHVHVILDVSGYYR